MLMTVSVTRQLTSFILMILSGGACAMAFDFFRSVSRQSQMPKWSMHVLDFLYCIFACFFLLYSAFAWNDASIGWYEILGVLLGAVLYFCLLSSSLIWIFDRILGTFFKIIELFLKFLLTPVVFLYRISRRVVVSFCECINRMLSKIRVDLCKKFKNAKCKKKKLKNVNTRE